MTLPREYVTQKFFMYGGRAKYIKQKDAYNSACPVCREGKSWTKKRRLYYFPKENFLLCFNCNQSWQPDNWVKRVSGMSWQQIKEELEAGHFNSIDAILKTSNTPLKNTNTEILPYDSINLLDAQQLDYYRKDKIVREALNFIDRRRLNSAINRPSKLFISLKDFVHKNRLIIPYEDPDHQIRFYQSRALFPKDEEMAKYLGKFNAEKTIFGLNNVKSEPNTLLFFEGAIDSMFVTNGLGMSGIRLTEHQHKLLAKYMFWDKIWVLDNDTKNPDVKKQYLELITEGAKIFIWPKKFAQFKDVNEVCCKLKLDKINPEFFIRNAYVGHEALTRLG